MANLLDEMNPEVLEEGRDINVIAKQIPVKVGVGSKIFEVLLWVLFIIPGIVFLVKKIKAATYLRQLEQKLQQLASDVDVRLEERVVVLSNLAKLVDKAVELDKETYVKIAQYRSGNIADVEGDNLTKVQNLEARLNLAIESYPELKSHGEISDAIQQNAYSQKEISAARELYNAAVNTWNKEIQIWPTKMIVAAKNGYTTRIPFATTKDVKQKAREVFF